MILDSIAHLRKYQAVLPLVEQVAQFVEQHPLHTLPMGCTHICGDDLYVNIVDAQPRTAQEAPLESHRLMADIQMPISGPEVHGHTSLQAHHTQEPYDAQADISFHPQLPVQNFFTVSPGQFVVYLPHDAHAPAITPKVLRKAIFKVKI